MFNFELIQLDFRAKIPLYLQLVEQLRQQIEHGWLQAEEQLPPVRTLAERLRVNFNTVARAYRILDIEGWISTQQGRGTFITTQSWPRPAACDEQSLNQVNPSQPAPGDLSSPSTLEPGKEAIDQYGQTPPKPEALEQNQPETPIQPAADLINQANLEQPPPEPGLAAQQRSQEIRQQLASPQPPDVIQHQDRNAAIAQILAQAAAEGITFEDICAYLQSEQQHKTARHTPEYRAQIHPARKDSRLRRKKLPQSTERRLTRPTRIIKRNPIQ
jgi:DNA-binding transcriptional regulator YhcF (GntR family)